MNDIFSYLLLLPRCLCDIQPGYIIMPSRKRNKGKERKAKKAELKAERLTSTLIALTREIWHGLALGKDSKGRKVIHCNHGLDLIADDNHPVPSFIDRFYINRAFNKMASTDNLRELFQTHREVWDKENYRQMAINMFIAIGTNFLLQKHSGNDAANIAFTITLLENYDGSGDFESMIFTRGAATKLRNFNGGSSTGIRDELKFFRKRTSCKCLKEMHLEARKASPKMGLCYHCDKVEERTLLMVCSRCRIAQYCSMECHMAGWSEHKCSCDKFVSFQKQQKQEAEKR